MTRRMNDGTHQADLPKRTLTAIGLCLALLGAAPAEAAVRFVVQSDATPPALIPSYKYLVNLDNTGVTTQRSPADGCSPADPGYPASCLWTSVAGVPGSSPVVTQGDQDDMLAGVSLPPGRYLVSVLADGWKLDGSHFTVDAGAVDTYVTVALHSTDLPDATIQAAVFEDISPVNGAPDVPAERGLAGFQGHIADYLGEVTTDVYGAPLCGTGRCLSRCYIVDGGVDKGEANPVDVEGRCPIDMAEATLSGFTLYPGQVLGATPAVEGKLKIPNLGPNRYALSITPPDGSGWVQTTTLEGNLDWDAWVMEGATGLDTEFIVAGEPFPAIIFGYVPGQPGHFPPLAGTGSIHGVVEKVKVYVPTNGGVGGLPGQIWGGLAGAKLDRPIPFPWVTLTDLTAGDTAVWVGRGDVNGAFTIPNVPAGNYTLTWWDDKLNHILDLVNVTVGPGEAVDMGILPLTGWWTEFEGYVFNDLNRNGIRDPGEPGIANFGLTMRKRENSLMDRGATAVTTDAAGHYVMENAYPMTQWLVMEAYNDRFYTTGVTFQADNQPTPTTVLGAGVDVSVLPIIGLSGRLDWGVHAYDPSGTNGIDPRNGGIVGTVSYDTTRNELDARYAFVEDWQPGIPGLTVNLYAPVDCPLDGVTPCDDLLGGQGYYALAPDGSYAKGQLLNTYVTERWQRPGLNGDGVCVPRGVDGAPLAYPAIQQVTNRFGDATDPSGDCLEGPLMGVQFQRGFSTVDGNYGFGDGCFAPNVLDTATPGGPFCRDAAGADVGFTALPGAWDYLVEVEIPNDLTGRPMYKVTREEDINIGNGDAFYPQVPPPACAGPLHIVDVSGLGTDGYPAMVGDGLTLPAGVTVPASTPTVNDTFAGIGGSPYEGQAKPLCNVKLVPLANGKSIVPTFNLYTDVPLPGRFWGLIVDDLNFSSNPRSLNYGEKAGVPFAPVGIYDFTNRLITTVESDYNGLFDVLMPSTNRISCPTPSGVCANLYRMVGNDPGVPGRLNPNYRPEFRTIAAEFEALPGLLVPADLAPTQVGVTVQLPGGQANLVSCALDAATPQLLAVSRPWVNGSGAFTIDGVGFGAAPGTVSLDGTALPISGWSDVQIAASVPAGTPPGPHQLDVTAANGQRTVNGLTFHVLGGASGAIPTLATLDNFNRANSSSLGGNWQQATILGAAAIRVNANQAFALLPGSALWNAPFGAAQAAAFTFSNTPGDGSALVLKGSGLSVGGVDLSYLRVRYTTAGGGQVVVEGTTNLGLTFDAYATLAAPFASGNRLTAQVDGTGGVSVWRTAGATTTLLGTAASPFAGGGQIGLQLPLGGRVDNFAGGNVTASGGPTYRPNVYEVGPGRTYATIQAGLDAAAASPGDDLVVVYPGVPDLTNPRANPRGAYYENLIVTTPVKLQGVGPGGFQGATFVPGSIVDGGAFGGDGAVAADWYTRILALTWAGNQTIYDGAVVSIFTSATAFTTAFKGAIDGFDLRGGDQQGFPGNLNAIGGAPTGLPANLITQGGAIYANGYARALQVTNNVIENNGGAYGTVRIGTPDLPAPDTSNHNEGVRIAHNRVIQNAGTNLAGGIGIFAGADGYEVDHNDVCGNFSAEYGGGLTAYGLSPGGRIHDNRIWFNRSYDEGGGVMIAGQLPADPTTLSPGSGPVDIYANQIQANLANDDGGGLRFLQAGNFPMNVFNNFIVNNVSTHEGGGIGVNDAPDVRIFNNTIMKNLTTATAVTSTGQAAPAGVSTSQNSDLLQATLPIGSPTFSNPLLFNNVLWDNRAGTRVGGTVTGLGLAGDATPIVHWDLGVADGTGALSPTSSVLQVATGTIASPTNVFVDPAVVAPYDTSVALNVWRTNPAFAGAILVALDLPPNLLGDYHLTSGSPAESLGAASKAGVAAPATDVDGQARPSGAGFEAGADELAGAVPPPPPPPPPPPGSVAFPSTSLLDTFNRANSANLGTGWSSSAGYRINSGNLNARSGAGLTTWTATFGPSQEAYLTFVQVGAAATEQGVVLKANATGTALIQVAYDPVAGRIRISTLDPTSGWQVRATVTGVSFVAGDVLGARAVGDGTVSAFKNGTLLGSTNVTSGTIPWPLPLAQGGGRVGVRFTGTTNANDARVDDFGGGSMP